LQRRDAQAGVALLAACDGPLSRCVPIRRAMHATMRVAQDDVFAASVTARRSGNGCDTYVSGLKLPPVPRTITVP